MNMVFWRWFMSAELNNKFNGMIAQLEKEFGKSKITPALTKISALVKTAINENFASYGRWDGSGSDLFDGGNFRWKPYAKSTKKQRQRKGMQTANVTLIGSNKMKRTIQVNPFGSSSIKITSNSPYAAIHQYGGTMDIPARESEAKWKATKNKKSGNYSFRFAKSKAKGKNIISRKFMKKAYQIKIPARPFVTLTEKDVDQIINACLKLLES